MGSRPVSGYGAGFSRERRLGGRPWVPGFAGMTIGGPPLRWDGGEGEEGEAPSPRSPSGFRLGGRNDGRVEGEEGDGFPPLRERRLGGRPYGGTEGRERDRGVTPHLPLDTGFRRYDGWGPLDTCPVSGYGAGFSPVTVQY